MLFLEVDSVDTSSASAITVKLVPASYETFNLSLLSLFAKMAPPSSFSFSVLMIAILYSTAKFRALGIVVFK